MNNLRLIVLILFVLAVCGCATTMPQGPSVMVMPAQGKPFAKFQEEDAECRKWGEKSSGVSAADAQNQNTISGAAIGSLIGAGAGALLGSASGNVGAGAAVGTGAGLLVGTAAGADAGRVSAREAQQRYDIAYSQCMASHGNQIQQPAAVPVPVYYPHRRVIVVPAEQPPVYYMPPPPPAPVYQPPPPPMSAVPAYPPPPPVYSTAP